MFLHYQREAGGTDHDHDADDIMSILTKDLPTMGCIAAKISIYKTLMQLWTENMPIATNNTGTERINLVGQKTGWLTKLCRLLLLFLFIATTVTFRLFALTTIFLFLPRPWWMIGALGTSTALYLVLR